MLKTLFPNGLKKAFTLSYDDGCYDDIRLLGMMSSRGIRGTFNISSGITRPEGQEPLGAWERMTPSELENYDREGIEVAVHGVRHRDFTKISESELIYEIMADKSAIERRFSRVIRGAAYPYGSFDDRSVEALRRCGIKYCRTVWSDDSLKMPADWLRLRPSCHHSDPKLGEMTERLLGEETPERRMLYVWGHTPEFRRDSNWELMERLLDRVAGRKDVWYATNIEICEYELAARALEYSADGGYVFNPTSLEIWLERNGEPMSVKPNETAEAWKE